MPTTRTRRTRNRLPHMDDALERFFLTGECEPGNDDLLWELWSPADNIFATWEVVKGELRRKHPRLLAWRVLKTGTVDGFPDYPWIDKAAYQRWKAKHD